MELAKESHLDAYDLMLKSAPGPTDIFVLPHFAGSGTPLLDTQSKGAVIGMTFATTKSDIAKAILEGLTFELEANLSLLRASGISVACLHAVGGGAKSPAWLQMKSDICNVRLKVPKVTEAACLGAAILATGPSGFLPPISRTLAQTPGIPRFIIGFD